MSKQNIRGKVALVTGASRGIGAAIAAELAARGARVALLGRDEAALAATTAALNGDHLYVVADVTSDESMRAATASVAERFGGIDIVVANAGIVAYGSVFVCTPQDFSRVLETNVTGTYRTVQAALPHLRTSRGYVLITGSIASFTSVGGLGAYAASKAAVESLAHTLYLELDHSGISVGMIYPSWVDTDMIANAEAAMPAFRQIRQKWARPAQIRGLSKWPGGTATTDQCARTAVNTIERRGRRAWVPLPVWAVSFARVMVNSLPGERVQLRLLGKTTREFDQDLQRTGKVVQPR